jgi:hypothetical protein
MPSRLPESGSQPATGIASASGRGSDWWSASRPSGFAPTAAERKVKAESRSCEVATKQQSAQSGEVGIAVAGHCAVTVKAREDVGIPPVSAKT